MVNEDWVKQTLGLLHEEAQRRGNSSESMMFRQAALLIEQFQDPGRQDPDLQTVNMVCVQLHEAYYRELNRVFKKSSPHLCQQGQMLLERLAEEADLHKPKDNDWRIWPLEDESYPNVRSAVEAYVEELGLECKGADFARCGGIAEWVVAGPQSKGSETYMSIAGACDSHREKVASREILGSEDPSRVEVFDVHEILSD